MKIALERFGISTRFPQLLSLSIAAGFFTIGVVVASVAIAKQDQGASALVTSVWVGVAIAALSVSAYFFWIRDKSTSLIVQSALWLTTIYTALFVSQFLIHDPADLRELKIEAAKDQRVPFDTRSVSEALLEKRIAGEQVYKYVVPYPILNNDFDTIPVGGISSVTTLMCNDSGEFIYYEADRNGMNNPDELWDNRGSIDFVFLGDSNTHGWCVTREDNIVDRFRSVYPESLNLGVAGSGPGYYSFIYRSLMRGVDIQNVFLLFYEGNDLGDLAWEVAHEKLSEYVTTSAVPVLDRVRMDEDLIEFHEAELIAATEEPSRASLLDIVLLREVTDRSRAKIRTFLQTSLPEPPLADLERIFSDLRDMIAAQGGELVIVYLPSYAGFTGAPSGCGTEGGCSRVKRDVVSLAADLGLDVVDVDAAFRSHPDPVSYFPFRLAGHYTPDGYQIVANEILEYVANR